MDPILEIARKHKLRVLEDCAQCCGGRYKGKFVGTIGDIGINSFQLSKTITAGEGGAVTTNDPKLFERAVRFHDVSSLRSPYEERLGGGLLAGFASCNFRMNEFTGAVLKAQVTKLDTICERLRNNARKVREGIADLPGLKLRKTGDQEGDLGVTVFLDHGTRERRDWFLRGAAGRGHCGLGTWRVGHPADRRPDREQGDDSPRLAVLQQSRGQGHPYGAECCPRTIDILGRHGGVIMDPNFSDEDLKDIVRAIRKVYLSKSRA